MASLPKSEQEGMCRRRVFSQKFVSPTFFLLHHGAALNYFNLRNFRSVLSDLFPLSFFFFNILHEKYRRVMHPTR